MNTFSKNWVMRLARNASHAAAVLALTLAAGISTPAFADPVDLSKTPPDLTKSVDPNIVVSFDDSGSMLATAMPDSVSDWGDFDEEYYYSSATNVIYYDPNKVYVPPAKPDGSPFPDSSYTNAWRDGLCANWPGTYCYGSANYVDLSDDFSEDFLNITSTSNTANTYSNSQECIPDSISISDCGASGGNGGGFYYTLVGTVWTKTEMNAASPEQQQNFANWYSYYRTRNLMTRTAVSRAFAQMGDNIRVAWQTINDLPLTASDEIKPMAGTAAGSWRYDFFTFLYNVHTAGSTPNRRATLRAGEFFKRGRSASFVDPYWNGVTGTDSATLTCRQNFQMLVTDGYWNFANPTVPAPPVGFFDVQGTPTLGDGSTTFTHMPENQVFWNVPASPVGSCAGGAVDCYPSLADIAFYYWGTDLQPLLTNNVPAYVPDKSTPLFGTAYIPGDDPLDNAEIYWNPKNDPATWQHMVNFMVTLGIAGNRNWPGDLTDLRDGTQAWPQPRRNAPEAADDTWHAAINSRGKYFSASDPNKLVTALTDILNSIIARRSSSVAGSLNTGVVTTETKSFYSGYDSSDWSGSLTAHEVAADGSIGPPLWDASCILTGGFCATTGASVGAARDPTTRVILTSTALGDGNGAAFRYASLSAAQQLVMNTDPATGLPDVLGTTRVDYLRGDRSQESVSPGMRRRGSVLGAVVNSQPAFVSYPASGWRDIFPVGSPEEVAAGLGHTYEQFAFDLKDRVPTVYVGANDGMLHAFNAASGVDAFGNSYVAGVERFAYVPYTVYPKLTELTSLDYAFDPTVDNSMVTGDAFFDDTGADAWHTMLVGTLRHGGRGVFALDITNPASIDETSAATTVLWEFNYQSTDAMASPTGENLGYTYGMPQIARLATGEWVVLVPAGYFPEDISDPHYGAPAASNTYSSLFVLDAETGELIRELQTPTTTASWGLSSPIMGDYESDQIADVAFAGDILGNLWRFDLTDPTPGNWTVDLVYEPDIPGEQPITVMPRLFPDPVTSKFMVVFGTGKYLGLDDRTNTGPVQTVYGIREQGPASVAPAGYYPVTHSDLLTQDLSDDSGIRILTDLPMPSGDKGWHFDLDTAAGERVVVPATALFNTNRAVFATLIPGGSDPCNPSRLGAILVVDAITGGPGGGLEALGGSVTVPTGSGIAGAVVDNPPASGVLPAATVIGGGRILIPGITLPGSGQTFGLGDAFWRRRSWRVLMDE